MAKARRAYNANEIKVAKEAIDDAIRKTLSSKYITQERRNVLEYNAITLIEAQFDSRENKDIYDRAYNSTINTINSWQFDFLHDDEKAKMNKTAQPQQPQTQPATVKTSEATPKPTEDKPDNKNMLIIVAVVAVIIVGVCIFFMTKKK